MQTKQQSQVSNRKNKVKKKNPTQEKIELLAKRARYYEELSYSVKSDDGKKILIEINSFLNDKYTELNAIAMKKISFPYEYEKEELNKLKSIRAQIEVLSNLKHILDSEKLMELSKKDKTALEMIKKGEPIEPTY